MCEDIEGMESHHHDGDKDCCMAKMRHEGHLEAFAVHPRPQTLCNKNEG